jgi:hypothetical protein
MKFIVLILAFSVAGVLSYGEYDEDTTQPSEEVETTETPDISEEDVLKKIDILLTKTRDSVSEKVGEKFLATFIIDSINKQCIYNKLNESNLIKTIFEEPEERSYSSYSSYGSSYSGYSRYSTSRYGSRGRYHERSGDTQTEKVITLSTAMALCSSRFNLIAEYLFENLMVNNMLVTSIIDDPSLSNYTSLIWCANKYAIQNHILESTLNDNKLKVAADNDEVCEDFMESAKYVLSGLKLKLRKELERPCVFNIFTHVEKVVIRTVLLLQIHLTDEQKKQERDNFVSETRKFVEESMKCASTPKTKTDAESHIGIMSRYM